MSEGSYDCYCSDIGPGSYLGTYYRSHKNDALLLFVYLRSMANTICDLVVHQLNAETGFQNKMIRFLSDT